MLPCVSQGFGLGFFRMTENEYEIRNLIVSSIYETG
jgi:hypothetical protein